MKSSGSTMTFLLLVFVLFPVLAFSGYPPRPSGKSFKAPASGEPPLIEVRDDLLTLELQGIPWAIVLKELQQQTGLTFRVQGRLNGTVTESFHSLPLEEGLQRLLHDADLIFLYVEAKEGQGARSRLSQVWVLPKGQGGQVDTAQTPKRPLREAVDPLGSLIQNVLAAGRGEEREKAVEALAEYRDPRVQAALLQALQDHDADVRESAADALADFKDEAAVDHLSHALLEDSSEDVRESAADTLGQIASPGAIQALRRALEDESADVRASAVNALWRIGGEQAIEALKRALRDEDEDVRAAAREALRKQGSNVW